MNLYKVIFHVDELSKWELVLSNAKNLIKAFSDDELVIEILANSEAVEFLVKSDSHSDKLFTDLLNNNAIFKVCNNSIKSLEIDPNTLFAFVSIVPSGVAELTIKQHEGFAYIKP